MVEALSGTADVRFERGRTRGELASGEPAESGHRDDPTGELETGSQHAQVAAARVGQVAGIEIGLREGIGRAKAKAPDAARLKRDGADGEPVPAGRRQTLVLEQHRAEHELEVGRRQPRAAMDERGGLADVRGQRPPPEQQIAGEVPGGLRPVEGHRPVGLDQEADRHMVVEVETDTRQVAQRLDPVLGELLGGPDAGEEQQLRRVDGPTANHHLVCAARNPLGGPVAVGDTDRSRALEQHARGVGAGDDGEIRPVERRPQVGVGSRPAPAATHDDD